MSECLAALPDGARAALDASVDASAVAAFESKVVAIMSIVFSYSGQVEFVELMAEMRKPHEFPKAVWATTAVMSAAYVVTAVVGYWFLGSAVKSPFTTEIPENAIKHASNFVIFVHVIIAYTIITNVTCSAAASAIAPHLSYDTGIKGRTLWLFVTLGLVMACFVLSNAVPFLADLMAVISAVCALATTYGFPCTFAVALLVDMSPRERKICQCIVGISLCFSCLGVYAAFSDIADKWHSAPRPPFSC